MYSDCCNFKWVGSHVKMLEKKGKTVILGHTSFCIGHFQRMHLHVTCMISLIRKRTALLIFMEGDFIIAILEKSHFLKNYHEFGKIVLKINSGQKHTHLLWAFTASPYPP